MAIHIDEIQTDVQVDPVPRAARPAPAEPPWQQLERLRHLQQTLLCDEARTCATGNHD